MVTIESRMENFQEQFTEAIQTHCSTIKEATAKSDDFTNQMENIYDQLRLLIEQANQKNSILVNTLNSSLLNTENKIQIMNDENANLLQVHKNELNDRLIISSKENLTDACQIVLTEMNTAINHNALFVYDFSKKMSQNDKEAMEIVNDHIENVASNISEKCEILSTNDLTKQFQQNIENHAQHLDNDNACNRSAINDIEKSIHSLSENTEKDIKSCHQTLDCFHKIDYVEYSPSGKQQNIKSKNKNNQIESKSVSYFYL